MESYWKVIKRNYLPRFFRPRLDLVIFIIIIRLIPHNEIMYNKYQKGREKVAQRKDFKKHWKNLATKEISEELYYTNTDQWICSCLAFLKDRFFLYKHLVKLVNNTTTSEFLIISCWKIPLSKRKYHVTKWISSVHLKRS